MNTKLNSLLLVICLGFLFEKGRAQRQGVTNYTNYNQCKENEEYSDCGSGCPLTCKNHRQSIFCTQQCRPGCFCKAGYVIGPNNRCILPEQCPIGPCNLNEVTSSCVNPCNNCLQKGRCYYGFCNPGCDCRPGHYRNSSGICVPEGSCESEDSLCPKNEHFVDCVNPCNDCWSRGECEEEYCFPGCDCKPGYIRDDYGACVPDYQCFYQGKSCGINEVFSECAIPCNDCERRGNCIYSCNSGCDCRKGYYRNKNGICMPASECSLTVCGLYEEYSECGSACPVTCSNLGKSIVCTQQCVKGCFCIRGYVRSLDGKCVRPSECPVVCGLNEEYRICGSACPPTCASYDKSIKCAEYCIKGCFCKPGYVKDSVGRCILPSSCPRVFTECPTNEIFQECGSQCELFCENRTLANAYCSLPCRKGCFCKPGYIRGPDKKCILPTSCPLVCREFEIFQECGSPCEASCANRSLSSVPCSLPCRRGCFCETGYIRGPSGNCILPASCPSICREFEIFQECGSPCEASCANRSITSANCSLPCRRGCFCEPGYIRGPSGNCILPASCPSICQEYEVFQECGSPCEESCANRSLSARNCSLPCRRGCFCEPGFIRGPTGNCILPSACPSICQEFEIFQECGSPCEASCTNRTPSVAECPLPCRRGCFCEPGYVRGPTGNCISPTSCPLLCEENEEFRECGPSCITTCDNLSNITACPPPCIRGCFCKPGLVKGPDGKCILPQQCPLICRINEEFNECGSACPANCTDRSPTCIKSCARGCFCRPGFIRGVNNSCVSPEECPVVCNENEEFNECGTTCPPTCANRSLSCASPCVRGCFCKPGFIRDSDVKCVLPIDCLRDCPVNETFRRCGSSCQITCTNIGRSINCRLECARGCFCLDGLIRGPDGRCIDPDLCPRGIDCGRDEVFKSCGRPCQQICANRTIPITATSCPGSCVSGCFCRPGFVRGQRGRCILKRLCPRKCRQNEEFRCSHPSCQHTCGNVNTPLNCPRRCIQGCYCRTGFVKGPYDKCIPPASCPRRIGSRNKGDEERDDEDSTTPLSLSELKEPATTEDNHNTEGDHEEEGDTTTLPPSSETEEIEGRNKNGGIDEEETKKNTPSSSVTKELSPTKGVGGKITKEQSAANPTVPTSSGTKGAIVTTESSKVTKSMLDKQQTNSSASSKPPSIEKSSLAPTPAQESKNITKEN